MDLGIAGRNALITGGSRGLGRQCAISMGGEGVNVAICGRTESTINATVDDLTGLGVKACGIVADVTQIDDLPRLYGEAVEGLGPIDILVNNAGGSMGATDLTETPLENYRAVFDFNLFNGYELSRLVLPHMQEQGWGRIINIASIYGREHGGNIAYMSAKAGVIAASKHAGAITCRIRRDCQLHSARVDPPPRRQLGTIPAGTEQRSCRRVHDSNADGEIRVAGADRRHVRFPRLEPCRPHNRRMHPGRRRSEPLADLTSTPS